MTGSRDADLVRRVEALEKQQEDERKWRSKVDGLINRGKGFWFAVILIGSVVLAAIGAAWEVLKHWRGVGA